MEVSAAKFSRVGWIFIWRLARPKCRPVRLWRGRARTWGGTGSGGPTDSWSSQTGLPAFEGGYEAFQMPGATGGGGGFGGVGFGSFGTARSGEGGIWLGGRRKPQGLIEIKVKFAGEQDKDLAFMPTQMMMVTGPEYMHINILSMQRVCEHIGI